MGKGRDKKKKRRDPQVSAKSKTKVKKSKDEEDIDALLKDFEQQQIQEFKITQEINVPVPSRRANASLGVNPLNPSELILFGGECFDGQRVAMFNDLFRYNTEKNEWKRITSPNSPGPRSSHQMCMMPSGRLFLFGGMSK